MPSQNKKQYPYGAGPSVSRRTLQRRRLAEKRRVERLSPMEWNNTFDNLLMAKSSSDSSSVTNGTCPGYEILHFPDNVGSHTLEATAASALTLAEGSDSFQDHASEGQTVDDHPHLNTVPAFSNEGSHSSNLTSSEEEVSVPEEDSDSDASIHNDDHDSWPFHDDAVEGDVDDIDDFSLLQKLCDCTNGTKGEAITMVMALGMRHCISWAGMVDILKLINVLLGRRVLPDSKHLLFKYVDPCPQYKLDRHVYCVHCLRYFGKQQKVNDPNVVCHCKPEKKLSFFVTIGLKKQLQEILKKNDVQKGLEYGFSAREVEREEFRDVYDGQRYRLFCQPPNGLLYKNKNLSVTANTDGFSLGKSTKRSAWPIYASLNELPPKERYKHMMLAGVWVGSSEPNMVMFLKPFVEELNTLSSEGVEWTFNGSPTVSKVIITCTCVDSPARSKMLNMKQFHGQDSCSFCYHVGTRVQGVIGWRYSIADGLPPLRTDAEMRNDMNEVYNRILQNYPVKRQVIRGIKGPSALMKLHNFDLANTIAPDLMHLFKLVQTLLFIYQDTGRNPHLEPQQVSSVSSRLVSCRPPSSISRLPRSLKDLKLLKCNELRNILLMYGMVCFKGILSDKYLAHFSLLSTAFRMLTKRSVSKTDVHKANGLILKFVFLYERHFGVKSMTINVHLLLHLPRTVLNHGPLWACNCFPFEGENRHLLNLVHSPGAVVQQITRRFICKRNTSILCDKYRVSDETRRFCEALGIRRLVNVKRSEQCVLPGSGVRKVTCGEEQHLLRQLGFERVNVMTCFEKVIYNNIRLTICSYSHGLKNDDSVVLLTDNQKGQIQQICEVEAQGQSKVVLILKMFVEDRHPMFSFEDITYDDVKIVVADGPLRAVALQDVVGQCLLMEVDSVRYITEVPFGCYGD